MKFVLSSIVNCRGCLASAQYVATKGSNLRLTTFYNFSRHAHRQSLRTVAKDLHDPNTSVLGVGTEALNVSHSRFLAEAAGTTPWKKTDNPLNPDDQDYKDVGPGQESALPEPPSSSHDSESKGEFMVPLVILLHPSQPLSHISRLIMSELAFLGVGVGARDKGSGEFIRMPEITFRNRTKHGQVRWSDSTDVGSFIRGAARMEHFDICFRYGRRHNEDGQEGEELVRVIDVDVGTFAERTRYLRRRLSVVESQLDTMSVVKRECDEAAKAGARRLAVGGFGMLVAYWGVVCQLTFFTSLGWDVMEPVTYLSGLSMVILGYLWFLYRGREVSYSSVLKSSIEARKAALYRAKGFDMDRWEDMVREGKDIRKEIARIAEDYDYTNGREKKEKEDSEEEEE